MSDTLVVLPTFNEAENLQRLVTSVLALSESMGVIVVDDSSPDGTGNLAEELRGEFPERVQVIHRPGKLGLGTAYVAGFEAALLSSAERIITMDADFSHEPRHILEMLETMDADSTDLVIGSRYVAGGETPDFPVGRRLLSGGANLFAHKLVGLQARDATSGFRCYRRETLEALPLRSILSNGYSFLVEILFLIQNMGFAIGEVPIAFHDRKHGKSKISRQEIVKAIVTVARLTLRRLTKNVPSPAGRSSEA